MQPLDLVTVAVLAFFSTRLFVSFRRSVTGSARRHAVDLARGLRFRHFWPVPIVLVLTAGLAVLLISIPPLDFGWWSAIGGQGNPALGVTDRTAGTAFEIVVPLVFLVLLTPALPLLAEREESIFRLGAESWSTPKRVAKAVLFGLVHALIGIPIGVALALSVGGGYFTIAYLRGWRATNSRRAAMTESTRAHLAYNATLVGLFLIALLAYVASTFAPQL